jgi:hypothetical protein
MKLRQPPSVPVLAVLFAIAIGIARPASAATILAIDDPSTVGIDVVLNDDDFDGVASTGTAISVGTFPFTFAFGVGNTAALRMDLAAVFASFEPDAALNLLFTQTGFVGDGLATASISGTTAGGLVYAAYYDPSDTAFGLANVIGDPLVFGPGAMLGSDAEFIAAGGSYSMTQAILLRHPAGEPTVTELRASIEVNPSVIPEPASMTLFGLGLSGAALLRRRRARASGE